MSIIAAIILAVLLRILYLRTEDGLTYRDIYKNFDKAAEHYVYGFLDRLKPWWICFASIFYVLFVNVENPYLKYEQRRHFDEGVKWWILWLCVAACAVFFIALVYDFMSILAWSVGVPK